MAVNSNPALAILSRQVLTSNVEPAQIAWRAYDSGATKIMDWPNLLALEDNADRERVYTTRESTTSMLSEGELRLESLSLHARNYAALCFLGSQDPTLTAEDRQGIWADFIFYIAEIRRAHNDTEEDLDNPSCFPGTISRIGLILNKHPEFTSLESVEQVVMDSVRAYVNQQLAAELTKLAAPEDKEKLFFSVMMLGLSNISEIIANPSSVLQRLSVEADNLTEEEQQQLIQDYIQLRANFFAVLHDGIIAYVKDYLVRHNITCNNEDQLRYLIGERLASLPDLLLANMSIYQKLIMPVEEQDVPATMQALHEDYSELLRSPPNELAKDSKDPRVAMQDYWFPLFKLREYQELITIVGDPVLCQAIIDERFLGFSMQQTPPPTVEGLTKHLQARNNAEILQDMLLQPFLLPSHTTLLTNLSSDAITTVLAAKPDLYSYTASTNNPDNIAEGHSTTPRSPRRNRM